MIKDMLISAGLSGGIGAATGGDVKKSAMGGALGAGAMHVVGKIMSNMG